MTSSGRDSRTNSVPRPSAAAVRVKTPSAAARKRDRPRGRGDRAEAGGRTRAESRADRKRASDAFRRWAQAGCPPPFRTGTARRDPGKPDENETDRDFRACASVFTALGKEASEGRTNSAAKEILLAVREILMSEPNRPVRRSEMTLRVRQHARERYVSERLVYLWLARARALWREFRSIPPRTDLPQQAKRSSRTGRARGKAAAEAKK